jgi:hypothetical protein
MLVAAKKRATFAAKNGPPFSQHFFRRKRPSPNAEGVCGKKMRQARDDLARFEGAEVARFEAAADIPNAFVRRALGLARVPTDFNSADAPLPNDRCLGCHSTSGSRVRSSLAVQSTEAHSGNIECRRIVQKPASISG